MDTSSLDYRLDDPLDNGDEDDDETPKNTGIWSYLSSLSSKVKLLFLFVLTEQPLTAENMAPVLAQFKEHLRAKNVATEASDKLCESVAASLEGKKLGTFQGTCLLLNIYV